MSAFFASARENMVNCQIHPNGVVSSEILDAYGDVPREIFLPDPARAKAYVDETVLIGDGRSLLAPDLHARMVQALAVRPGDVVLDVAGGTGYSAAILSRLAGTVVSVESNAEMLRFAVACMESLSVCNVVHIQGDVARGCPEHGPYDAIFINGAVREIPESLLGQLSETGRLVCVLIDADHPSGCAVRILSRSGEAVSVLFDASAPCLPEFEGQTAFSLDVP